MNKSKVPVILGGISIPLGILSPILGVISGIFGLILAKKREKEDEISYKLEKNLATIGLSLAALVWLFQIYRLIQFMNQ